MAHPSRIATIDVLLDASDDGMQDLLSDSSTSSGDDSDALPALLSADEDNLDVMIDNIQRRIHDIRVHLNRGTGTGCAWECDAMIHYRPDVSSGATQDPDILFSTFHHLLTSLLTIHCIHPPPYLTFLTSMHLSTIHRHSISSPSSPSCTSLRPDLRR
jgi:hypothetical protein